MCWMAFCHFRVARNIQNGALLCTCIHTRSSTYYLTQLTDSGAINSRSAPLPPFPVSIHLPAVHSQCPFRAPTHASAAADGTWKGLEAYELGSFHSSMPLCSDNPACGQPSWSYLPSCAYIRALRIVRNKAWIDRSFRIPVVSRPILVDIVPFLAAAPPSGIFPYLPSH